ncbi:hypothetical protein NARC_80023 [Candidatus Nitrosocosmicus arcticus]|uniref:Uncharacterized protein n=1 Tax=Candidatus Nitrosocosmicus arcticus TaxID=2035267 RepID=A0A557SUL8_9ARCH|nr:hypothetical protein NARC_80023 [Candidatus Nitrosocosmicus arcticus]
MQKSCWKFRTGRRWRDNLTNPYLESNYDYFVVNDRKNVLYLDQISTMQFFSFKKTKKGRDYQQ